MLRIHMHTSSAATRSYYTAADYYTDEARGVWLGHGAESLGLRGEVDGGAFEDLCENRHPATGRRLTALTAADRTVAYDFNFNAPKSVSALHALTGDERLREAVEASVRDAIEAVELEMRTRVRRGGADGERVTGNLVGALFTHTTARPVDGIPDPHLHCHAVIFNCTHDAVEGKWKAGQFRELKRDAPYFEAVFHSALAARVQALGYPVARTSKGWEVGGVPAMVRAAFSRRTAQIEEVAAARGVTEPAEKGRLGATSRTGKGERHTPDALRAVWAERIGEEAVAVLHRLREKATGTATLVGSGATAIEHAVEHCFARDSVVAERELHTVALRRGYGEASPVAVQQALATRRLVRGESGGRAVVTTQDVLAEEQKMVAFARDGRGTCAPLGRGLPYSPSGHLGEDQRRAVRHLLESPDRVLYVKGRAGVGKTTLLREAVAAIAAGGRRVFAFAPSADASRGTLRQEGFATADTVARLLADERLQEAAEGHVLLVDEAGLLGSRTTAALFALAERRHCRVILVGDPAQHRGVERGAALRILEAQAGVLPVEVRDIRRQAGEYKAAVAALAAGRTAEGFDRLDRLGWVREVADDTERAKAVAAEYAERTGRGESVLVVSPTHAEGERVTAAIRSALRAAGRLGEDERTLGRLTPTRRTEAERRDPATYQPGEVVQFVQNAPGITRGERFTVLRVGAGEVVVRDRAGGERPLPLAQAGRFEAFRSDTLTVGVGDRLRLTMNGTSRDGHRLNNGAVYGVAGFTADGGVHLDNGWEVPAGFGHWASGFVVTSHASQGRTVDHVLIAQSRASGRAASPEQVYVSASRGRHGVTAFVDDKAGVREAVAVPRAELSAHDLVNGRRADPRGDALRRFARRLREAVRWATGVVNYRQTEQGRKDDGRRG